MEKKWWHDKVAYQIYPKSFYDSNGDGIGDLPGIIEKLDDLKALGIDIIWISPCYYSPMADQGYDISDYYRIDPVFGTMEDMDKLLVEAKKRDMYILMDLVVNHCSDEHMWFQEMVKDPEGPYGQYFYLAKKDENGQLPCNLRAYFGGSVWEPVPNSDYYYFHSFHRKQPDLNWENPVVREEIYKMINWWLDKGLAGFRIDAIINIQKALPFKHYPADREDGLAEIGTMLSDAKGVTKRLNELADRTFRPHESLTIGELFNADPKALAEYIGPNGCFSSIFDFEKTIFGHSEKGWYANQPITLEDVKHCTFLSQKRADEIGMMTNILENHDEPRGVSRYIPHQDLSLESKKMLAVFYFFLKGLPFIYQGQEIGQENTKFSSIDEIEDISTLGQYEAAKRAGLSDQEALEAVLVYSRDHARTPVQWNDCLHAGFTTGTPWFPVNPNYPDINWTSQKNDPDSLLNFYREMIALRKNAIYKDTFVYGEMIPLWEEKRNLLAYERKSGEQRIVIICNGQKEKQEICLPQPIKKVLLNNMKDVSKITETQISLSGYQALVLLI